MFKKKLISKFRHLSKTDGRFFFKIIKVKYIYYNFIFVFILVYRISLNIGSENKSLISHAEKNFAINWTKSNKKTSCIRKCLRSSGELYFFFDDSHVTLEEIRVGWIQKISAVEVVFLQ